MNRLIFEKSNKGRKGSFDIDIIPKKELSLFKSKDELDLPEVSELDVVRHYSNLEKENFSVDHNFYPLGSCTMKYNPKLNEAVVRNSKFNNIHPLQYFVDIDSTQGSLDIIYNLNDMLCKLTGMDYFTSQPMAGAHGELTGTLIIAKYHKDKGNTHKNHIIVPDSSHGTNPASAQMAGFNVVTVPSDENGFMSIDKLKDVINDETAGVMLTVPNTLGIFNEHIKEICEIAHSHDALMYYDGANFNALLGVLKPGELNFDIVHLNLHKTFATPHGGGGPGAGPVGVKAFLKDYLPNPFITKDNNRFVLEYSDKSIGNVSPFFGNFEILLRAYAYILSLGGDGLENVSEMAVLNANYVKEKLKDTLFLPYDKVCMHEVVFSIKQLKKEHHITALDIAKALIDKGIHPPTIYFPLNVEEAFMIEPTETESKETLDNFISTIKTIIEELKVAKDVHDYPITTKYSRFDETKAARELNVKYSKPQ